METQKQESGAVVQPELARHRHLSSVWRAIVIAVTVIVTLLAVNQLFNAGFLVGHTWLDNEYQYALFGLLVPVVFLIFPATSKSAMDRVPWYDILFAVVTFGLLVFFFMNAEAIVDNGWEMGAPDYIVMLGLVLWLLVLEGTRRAGGTALFAIVVIISLYPLYADIMPGPISGLGSTLSDTTAYHVLSAESMLGIPMQALANLVIGFLIFGVALTQTGGGKFFIDLAFAALGHVRGGPAKVAIFSSGLMGSMSGSVISNVITTGVMTIPAMRKTGFRPSYAAGVEACASTGGVLMPPIMGSTAFIMAVFLNIPYITIAVAAIIPSVLYYLALFIQIDAYAARNNMPGLPRELLPKLGETFRKGWHFIAVFVLLIVMLVYLKQEVLAPFYATALLIVINQIFSPNRWGMKEFWEFLLATGKLLAEIAAILVGVGLIVGALSITGMAGTLVNDLIFMAGGNILVLLLMGAITSFIMGIGMTVTAAYIFLAIVLAPALVQGGLDPMSVHLFILYWGMVSFITPPVALGAFAAASIAGANPMRTGFEAMRLGSIIYFVPFFFVLDPALIFRGELSQTALLFVSAVAGVILVASSLQGYLIWIGNLHRHPVLGWPIRAFILIGGLALATPGGSALIPFSNLELALFALVTAGSAAALAFMIERRAKAAAAI
ncbi:TRAP transporter fused permease subunit [Sneathiella sp. CAU 1612]|uniref:TRAP transporter fused permease subunit n=1 Tax=Sneathiella sedimenti TaxID=2816034 RepID=A0ABS3F6B3_9PROT|nr:TRAP transporter fused permease subunit [Sneathiella sedimenti]MBO0334064.1 TRAP transporter fused permease subunit [Sneathiella sedimenti]